MDSRRSGVCFGSPGRTSTRGASAIVAAVAGLNTASRDGALGDAVSTADAGADELAGPQVAQHGLADDASPVGQAAVCEWHLTEGSDAMPNNQNAAPQAPDPPAAR